MTRINPMLTDSTPRILFVPGKNPKPPPDEHRAQLWRCLLEGVRRADADVHARLALLPDVFSLVAWNHSYYGSYRDMNLDLPWIDLLLSRGGPTARDRREARHWRRRLMKLAYLIGDLVPALIPLIPDPKVKATIEETVRYFSNRQSIAEIVRRPLQMQFLDYCSRGAPVLVIAHSLGSVIAYDAFWSLSHLQPAPCRVDQFLTIGSPLGTRFVQHRVLGHGVSGRGRYPTNIRRWINITAVGDLTAFDPELRDDFREMIELGLIDEIRDNREPVYNCYRSDEGLNVHRSYGYLVNPAVGGEIANWWKAAGGMQG